MVRMQNKLKKISEQKIVKNEQRNSTGPQKQGSRGTETLSTTELHPLAQWLFQFGPETILL